MLMLRIPAALLAFPLAAVAGLYLVVSPRASAQTDGPDVLRDSNASGAASDRYQQLQQRLARGWNTWDTNSMTTHVLLPEGLAIHVGFKHNSTEFADAFLERTSVGAGRFFLGRMRGMAAIPT